MNYYIESLSTDPRHNLALEQFVFDSLDRSHSYFLLWQNDNSVIIGKNQNTAAEINSAFVNLHKISVCRRLSGGGAVYHDLGNLNYTFITDTAADNAVNFAEFCRPVREALLSFGVPVEISGRNDMTVEGKKFSGSAHYVKQGRIMHHGTLLYDSDLDMLSKALKVTDDKIESKGIKSVKSRVANIRPFMKKDMPLKEFWTALKSHFFISFDMKEYRFNSDEEAEIEKLEKQIYSRWDWNYGASPSCNIHKTRRVKNCGKIEVFLDVERERTNDKTATNSGAQPSLARIKNIAFYGDFFGNDDASWLAGILKGRRFEYNEIKNAISGIGISRFFHNLDEKTFLKLLFE